MKMRSLTEVCVLLGYPDMDTKNMTKLSKNVLSRYREDNKGADPPKIEKRFTKSQVHQVYTFNDEVDLVLIAEEVNKLYD